MERRRHGPTHGNKGLRLGHDYMPRFGLTLETLGLNYWSLTREMVTSLDYHLESSTLFIVFYQQSSSSGLWKIKLQ